MEEVEEGEVVTMFRLTSRVLDLCQVFPIVMINCPCMTSQSVPLIQRPGSCEEDLEFRELGNPFRCFKDRLGLGAHSETTGASGK